MERSEVLAVLDSLAAGQPPEVVLALTEASAIVRANANRPALSGARWTDEEDARLCREFDEGIPVGDIAKAHNRSTSAIQLRLLKLGRLTEAEVNVRRR